MRPGQAERRATTTCAMAPPALCRARQQNRQGHQPVTTPPPIAGVPQVPQHHRGQRTDPPRRASGDGQLRHPRDRRDPTLDGAPPALPRPLQTHSASWLNQVERFFAALTEKQIRRGSFRSTQQLEAAIRHYLDHTTPSQSRSDGQNQQTTFSTHSSSIVNPLMTHHTRDHNGNMSERCPF